MMRWLRWALCTLVGHTEWFQASPWAGWCERCARDFRPALPAPDFGPHRTGKPVDVDAERRKHTPSDPGARYVGAPNRLRFVEGHVVDDEGRIVKTVPLSELFTRPKGRRS